MYLQLFDQNKILLQMFKSLCGLGCMAEILKWWARSQIKAVHFWNLSRAMKTSQQ